MSDIFTNVSDIDQIIEVDITSKELEQLEALAEQRGVLNNKTLVNGEGNFAGFAGELIVNKYLGNLLEKVDDIHHDYLFEELKIDVKTKGNCKSKPLIDYDCTVPQYQLKIQNCDIYIFTRISATKSIGWICGWTTKNNFLSVSQTRWKGQSYNYTGRTSVGNHGVCLVKQLYTIESFKNFLTHRLNRATTVTLDLGGQHEDASLP